MKSPLHILHLEDDPNDAELIKSTLKAGGINCAINRVQCREDFVAALEHGGTDLIISDFSLPAFNGLAATEIAHTKWPDLPVILVSGTLGEELAIDALRSGATDYVLKERLARLAPAVRRAMQEVEKQTERRRLEAQFIEAQKMEVIGHLASGVAHDFNNILLVIAGYSDLITSELAPDSPLKKYAQQIRHASERAVGLTRQLLVFSRKQKVLPVVLDLNDVGKNLENMLRRLVDEHIKIVMLPGKQIGRIKADSGYVGQVLMNLVVNARDAMPNGGKLTIATSNVTLAGPPSIALAKEGLSSEPSAKGGPPSVASSKPGLPFEPSTKEGPPSIALAKEGPPSIASAKEGDYVMLSVTDTGTGMTDEVKAHLFEAFFTTKPKGKGTGLGLATCQTIVHQSGGHIGVDSEVGKGTTFKVYFPRVEQPLEVGAISVQAGPLPHGTETLLIVEDDPFVRRLACGVLQVQGYEVLSAANGQDGLHMAREHKGSPIRLVVTDVIMPLMGGKVMAEWLKATHPEIKILFTSGYTEDAIAHHGVLDSGAEFLPKPYTPATLARKIRAMLDNGSDTAFLRKQDVALNQSPPVSTQPS
jgi:two-component system cell cycle sensor histidine kinase/response regulator CckA